MFNNGSQGRGSQEANLDALDSSLSRRQELDQYKEQLYGLQRSYKTALATQEYLSAELETIQGSHEREKTEWEKRHNVEVGELRQLLAETKAQQGALESRCENYERELASAQGKVRELEAERLKGVRKLSEETEMGNELEKQVQDLMERIEQLESERRTLMEHNERMQEEAVSQMEKVECLEENLKAKREALEEKDEQLEQLQDMIHELQSEGVALKAAATDDVANRNQKGNSLFAEVHDQRQRVVNILDIQNKSMLRMQKAYREHEAEIRRLKEENALMVNEVDKCRAIIMNADRTHTEKLAQRIQELQWDADQWQKQVRFLESQLNSQGGGLTSILQYCRPEAERLRVELNQCRLIKCDLAENLHESQKELAQWRFQCLKYKCIVIDREMRLEANNIKFEERGNVPIDETVEVAFDKDLNIKGEHMSQEADEEKNDDVILIGDDTQLAANISTDVKKSIGHESDVPLIDAETQLENAMDVVEPKEKPKQPIVNKDIVVDVLKPKFDSLTMTHGADGPLLERKISPQQTGESNQDGGNRKSPQQKSLGGTTTKTIVKLDAENKENDVPPMSVLGSKVAIMSSSSKMVHNLINPKSILVRDKISTHFMDNHNKKVQFSKDVIDSIAEIKTENPTVEQCVGGKPETKVKCEGSQRKIPVRIITIKSRPRK